MFSIYTTLFNIKKHNFPWRPSLENFVKFCKNGDEIVIAVNKSEDNTLSILKRFAEKYPIIKIIETDFSYNDIEFDGKIKNAALQATTKPVKIQMDADEIFVLSHREKWEQYGKLLLDSNAQCLMIPTLDLYGNEDKIRLNHNIGLKFRMHKAGLKRGVWKHAWKNGKIDTSMSDSCELLNHNDELVESSGIVNPQHLTPLLSHYLSSIIYTVHLGYLDFEHRLNINNKLWKDHWELRSGHEENVAIKKEQLDFEPTIKHNLPII